MKKTLVELLAIDIVRYGRQEKKVNQSHRIYDYQGIISALDNHCSVETFNEKIKNLLVDLNIEPSEEDILELGHAIMSEFFYQTALDIYKILHKEKINPILLIKDNKKLLYQELLGGLK